MIIDNEVFGSYSLCKYKGFLKYTGEKGMISDYEEFQKQREDEYKMTAVRQLLKKYEETNVLKERSVNNDDLKTGHRILLGITIEHKDLHVHVDVLEKIRRKSALGSFSYIPYMFVTNNKVGKHDKCLLAFIGYILGKAQKRSVEYGIILYGESVRKSKIDFTKYQPPLASLIEEIRELAKKDKQPRLMLNKHCPICEFQKDCEEKARDKDDLSLLRGMKEKEIKAQNNKGIFTITQYSYTFRPRKRRKKATNLAKRRYHALQGLAIREQKIFIYGEPNIPTSSVRIYMDIETVPYRDFVYLIGLVIDTDDETQKYSFWADSKAEEELIVEQFLKVVKNYNEFLLFHYGSIEIRYIKYLNRSFIGKYKSVLDILLKKSVNVLSLIYGNFYFPVYENSLKSIAGYLGFRWSEENPSGLNSIMMRERWEKNRNNDLKDRLLLYNLEDCYATKKVTEHLFTISSGKLQNDNIEDSRTLFVKDFKFPENRTFKKNDFVVKEFNLINKCAYFDYQRDKIYIRSNKTLKKRLNRNIKKRKQILKPNKVIEVSNLEKCPNCCNEKLNRRGYVPHTVIDLKYSIGGVKRWIVKYHQYRFKCAECNRSYTLKCNDIERYAKYGHGLISWAVFENIVKGVSYRKVQIGIEELFKLSISRTSFHNFKLYAADYYESTYKGLLNKIFNSAGVIHVDETPVKLTKSTGYIWVFTNTVDVAFIFRPTREGDFLRKHLDGFKGVLVSDFYGAYDSLDCVQQKCLIHLIRDLNSDLIKAPFDEEFKSFVQDFGSLLKTIVETIDRYGLRKRHLKKHKKDVDKFLTKTLSQKFTSDLAIQYQKRFKKNRGKLFSFLDYDGVSWNNNNAEYAFKHFAVYRHKVNGIFSESGIKAYLVLLSIYQTCQYKQLSFLEFLLSKEREIP